MTPRAIATRWDIQRPSRFVLFAVAAKLLFSAVAVIILLEMAEDKAVVTELRNATASFMLIGDPGLLTGDIVALPVLQADTQVNALLDKFARSGICTLGRDVPRSRQHASALPYFELCDSRAADGRVLISPDVASGPPSVLRPGLPMLVLTVRGKPYLLGPPGSSIADADYLAHVIETLEMAIDPRADWLSRADLAR
jgi:hypothetical protein